MMRSSAFVRRASFGPSYHRRAPGRNAPAVVAALLALAGIARADDPAVKEIRGLLDRQVADWNRRDLDGFCAGYWNSPELVFLSGGDRTQGWAAMRERYRKRYQAEGKSMGTLAFREIEVELLGPDSAFVRGRWDLEMPDSKKIGGRFTLIVRKKIEGWRIVHDHTSSDAP